MGAPRWVAVARTSAPIKGGSIVNTNLNHGRLMRVTNVSRTQGTCTLVSYGVANSSNRTLTLAKRLNKLPAILGNGYVKVIASGWVYYHVTVNPKLAHK